MIAVTADEAFSKERFSPGARSLRPVPGESRQTQRKSELSRRITSRQMKDQKPVCTNRRTGPLPTSVTAIVRPSTSSPEVRNGQTSSNNHDGRFSGFRRFPSSLYSAASRRVADRLQRCAACVCVPSSARCSLYAIFHLSSGSLIFSVCKTGDQNSL